VILNLEIDRSSLANRDAEKLSAFLRAIGFRPVHQGETSRPGVLLAAHRGLFSINMLPSNSPQPVGLTVVVRVDNPDVVFDVAKRFDFKTADCTLSDEVHSQCFCVALPGDVLLHVVGGASEPRENIEGTLNAAGKKFAVVVSRFNAFITERLLHGALDGLERAGAIRSAIDIVRVPGAFEIPSAARTLAETGKYDAILCIGCLLRGDTAHYDVIANEVTRGIGQSAQETGVPHAFGVLTCDTLEQAIDRAGLKAGNKGFEAALAAIEMASLTKKINTAQTAPKARTLRSDARARTKRKSKRSKVARPSKRS
jgi:6,7-dimethyl-8-ribityllumazine synthase